MGILKYINRKITLQYLYVLFIPSIRYIYRAKVGISNDVDLRIKQIGDSIYNETRKQANVRCAVKIPFLNARNWEGVIHRLTRSINADMPGSGRTEWRWYLNIITALLVGYFGRELNFKNGEVMRFCFIAFLPIPLDLIMLAIVAFLFELSLLIGAIFILYSITKYIL